MRKSLKGPMIKDFQIGSWCPTSDGTGNPTAVAITIQVEDLGDLVIRLKSPERVDEVIQLLQQYKQEVWAQPLVDGQHRHKRI